MKAAAAVLLLLLLLLVWMLLLLLFAATKRAVRVMRGQGPFSLPGHQRPHYLHLQLQRRRQRRDIPALLQARSRISRSTLQRGFLGLPRLCPLLLLPMLLLLLLLLRYLLVQLQQAA
jgi:hypothetical protein